MTTMRLAAPFLAILLGACAATGDSGQTAETFDDIAPDEQISMTGTEPFWGGKVAGGTMTYSTPEDVDGTAFAVERFAGNSGLGFRGTLDGRNVQAMVTRGECSDGMSDRTFPYTATVQIGEQILQGCAYTDRQPFSGPAAP